MTDSADFLAGRLSGYQTVLAYLNYATSATAGLDAVTLDRLREAVGGMAESTSERIRDHGSLAPTKDLERS